MPAKPLALPSLCEQMVAAAACAAELRRASGGRPAARAPKSASVTRQVLVILGANHPRWHEHGELMRLTGASRGAISWAVRYLQERGLARSIHSNRHPQYRRYQAVVQVKS